MVSYLIVFIYCIRLNRDRSYIDSPDWIKNIKTTTNPINKKNDNWFQYAETVSLNHEKIEKNPERILKNRLLISIIEKE